jgi:hypothetical protein
MGTAQGRTDQLLLNEKIVGMIEIPSKFRPARRHSLKMIDLKPCHAGKWNFDWGSFEVHPSAGTPLEAAPKPFSALVDNLSPYSGIL